MLQIKKFTVKKKKQTNKTGQMLYQQVIIIYGYMVFIS